MVDLGIYHFVRNALAAKQSRAAIEAALARQGLDSAAIAEAIAAAESGHEPTVPHPDAPVPERHTLGVLLGVLACLLGLVLLAAVSMGTISLPMTERLAPPSNQSSGSTGGGVIGNEAALTFLRATLGTIAEEAEIYRNGQAIAGFGEVRGCDGGVFASPRVAALLTEIRTRTGATTACRSDATSFVIQVSVPISRAGVPTYFCVDSSGRPPSESPAPLGRGATACS